MSNSNGSYQPLPDGAGPTQVNSSTTTSDAPVPPATLTKSNSQNSLTNSPSAVVSGSAGVPPKIINLTKQAFTQQANHVKSPIHAQLPGSANVTAKVNMAAGGKGSGPGRSSATTTAHSLPTVGSPAAGGAAGGGVNLRGKVKQPMRTTKTSQKLTLFPEEKDVPVLEDEYAFDDTTYNQIGQLSSGM